MKEEKQWRGKDAPFCKDSGEKTCLAWQLRPCYTIVGRCKSLVVDHGDPLSKGGLVAGRSASRFPGLATWCFCFLPCGNPEFRYALRRYVKHPRHRKLFRFSSMTRNAGLSSPTYSLTLHPIKIYLPSPTPIDYLDKKP